MGSAATFASKLLPKGTGVDSLPSTASAEGCSGRSAMDGVTESTDLPPTLDTLPIEVVQQILSVAASTTTADALSLTNSGLCRTVSNATADVLLPVFSLPQREIGMCCPAAVVALDGDTLRKTARLGHAMVVFAERLGQRDAILELEILELPAWGALQVGILTSGADGKVSILDRPSAGAAAGLTAWAACTSATASATASRR